MPVGDCRLIMVQYLNFQLAKPDLPQAEHFELPEDHFLRNKEASMISNNLVFLFQTSNCTKVCQLFYLSLTVYGLTLIGTVSQVLWAIVYGFKLVIYRLIQI